MKIFMKLPHQYIAILLYFSTTSNHLHPLQVENCDSNSRLLVDEDDNAKFRPERVLIRHGYFFSDSHTYIRLILSIKKTCSSLCIMKQRYMYKCTDLFFVVKEIQKLTGLHLHSCVYEGFPCLLKMNTCHPGETNRLYVFMRRKH